MAQKPRNKSKSKLANSILIEKSASGFSGRPDAAQALLQSQEIQGLDVEKMVYQLQEAELAGERLDEILRRCQELAREAAEEHTPLARRVILQSEADKLVEEYNTIIRTVDFGIARKVELALSKQSN